MVSTGQPSVRSWNTTAPSRQLCGRSTLRKSLFADQASALLALQKERDAQLKKGFQLMFAQGADAPK